MKSSSFDYTIYISINAILLSSLSFHYKCFIYRKSQCISDTTDTNKILVLLRYVQFRKVLYSIYLLHLSIYLLVLFSICLLVTIKRKMVTNVKTNFEQTLL